MEASLLIKLIDQVTGPAAKVRDAIKGIREQAAEFKGGFADSIRRGFSVENIETATRNAERAFARSRTRLLGAIAAATTVAAPARLAAQFDQSMKGLEKVLDAPIERLQALRRFALETSALIPIAAKEVVELMAEAVQGGVPEADLERFSRFVANAAVAFDMAGAEIGERFAKLRNVYKLNQEGIEDLGDATNHLSNNMAAKAREITDFANRAAGAAAIFKLTATETAALGTAMIAAGVVPETAARGFTAMATRILSGGKEVDKAFKSIGMSRRTFLKELEQDAPAAIQNLFTTMATSKKGMEALIGIAGRDFADDFAKLLGNPELLAQAFDLIADKAAYAGSAVEEASKQAAGASRQWDLLVNKLTRLGIVVGEKILPPLLKLADQLGDVLDRMVAVADANPALAEGIVQAVAAMLALTVAARVLSFVLAGARLSLVNFAAMFLKFDGAGRNIATGWRMLAAAGRFLAPALGLVKAGLAGLAGMFAGLTWPIWLVIAALLAAGVALWKYWDRVKAFTSGFASAFADAFGPAIQAAIDMVDGLLQKLSELTGVSPEKLIGIGKMLAGMFDLSTPIDAAKRGISEFMGWLGSFFSQEQLSEGEIAGQFEAGRAMGQALIDGVKAAVEAHIIPLRDLFNFAVSIDWPEPPAWVSWLVGQAESAIRTVSNTGGEHTAGRVGIGGAVGVSGPPVDASAAEAALERGGRSVAEGGEAVGNALNTGAAALERAAKAVDSAAGKLAGVRVGGPVGLAAGAPSAARTGALHDGGE